MFKIPRSFHSQAFQAGRGGGVATRVFVPCGNLLRHWIFDRTSAHDSEGGGGAGTGSLCRAEAIWRWTEETKFSSAEFERSSCAEGAEFERS
eukprot:834119-Prorocentrum_minimum.AAC.1